MVIMQNLQLLAANAAQNFFYSAGGFGEFKAAMENFFLKGLGGEGAAGFGIAIAVVGIICAGISFAVHKFNPQSKMPGWITCLVIGFVGAMLIGGVQKPLDWLKGAVDVVYGWIGI